MLYNIVLLYLVINAQVGLVQSFLCLARNRIKHKLSVVTILSNHVYFLSSIESYSLTLMFLRVLVYLLFTRNSFLYQVKLFTLKDTFIQ